MRELKEKLEEVSGLHKLLIRNCKNTGPAEKFALDRKAGIIDYMGAGLPVVCFDGKNNRRFLKDGGIYAADNKKDH